jgi:hypothetical protein
VSRRVFVAAFRDEESLLAAVRHARGSANEILEVHGPWPVHGLGAAIGQRPSRLPWACFAFGLVGLAVGVALQVWTSAFDWPLNVGGKPLVSAPAFVPVAFELTVLFGGLGTVAFFLFGERRRRRLPPVSFAARTTDDLFALSLLPRDATYDADALSDLYRSRFGAVETEELIWEDAP